MRLLLLLAAHCLCDYPLQGEFLSKGKNHTAPLAGVPWYQCLWAHSMIHAGAVTLITGSIWLGCAELVLHCVIDYLKCSGKFGFNADQSLHIACKILWSVL